MTYELAKELQEAGFVQKEPLMYPPYKSGDDTSQTPGVYIPTLSELIEACGGYKGHFKLIHIDGGWCAAKGRDDSEGYTINLPTPEEAVARLWLALNTNPSL